MSNYTAITLMGGQGSPLLGAKWAGFTPILHIEPRPFFNKDTFEYNFPGVPYSTHLNTIDDTCVDNKGRYHKLQEMDPTVIIGSPSCKQFSNLGTKRKDRGKLHTLNYWDFEYYGFLESVKYIKPHMFILENVGNVKKTFWMENDIYDSNLFFSGTGPIKSILTLEGYHTQYIMLDAYNFGVPQHRKRLFLIGHQYGHDIPIFNGISDSTLFRDLQVPIFGKTVGQVLRDMDPALPNNDLPNHSQERVEGFKKLEFGESYYGTQNNRRLNPDKPSGTIASHCSRFVHPYAPRVLTVRERARLMGFPDDFIFYGNNTSQLDQVGKAIVPQVIAGLLYYFKNQNFI